MTRPSKIDHRGYGWTLWREVYGTFIGVLPLIIAVSAAAITVVRDNDRHELEIVHLKEADKRQEDQLMQLRSEGNQTRIETLGALKEIVTKIEVLQIQVSKMDGRTSR